MKKESKQLLMIIGIYLAIAIMLLSIIVLVKNIDEIRTDPILYGMDKNNFNSCTCYSDDKIYEISKEGKIESRFSMPPLDYKGIG